jgi:malonyl-CoA O-methyltransferase
MLVAPLEGYGIWAASYDAAPNPLVALERRVMSDVLRDVRGPRVVVDVACGTGYWTRRLEQAGAIVFGFDLSPEMVGQARSTCTSAGRYLLADVSAIAVRSEIADLTLCSLAASYFPDLKQAMSEMARVTRRRGRVIISDMHPAAIAAGWKRSFREGNNVYEIAHQQWSEECFLAAGRAAGLQPKEQFDEAFAEPERALFAAARREHMFDNAKRVPAIRITTWIRL